MLLMITISVPIGVMAQSDAGWDSENVVGEDGTESITVSDTSILSEVMGTNFPLKNGPRASRGQFEMKAVQDEGMEDLRSTNLGRKVSGEDRPIPSGSSDPEPTDAPFLVNDVLVYNDAVNSERNPDLTKTSNGDLYVAYDHDTGTGLRDVYVSKSTDGGLTWAQRDIAVDAAEDEYCPSIAGDYSPTFGTDMLYVWYNSPTFEFAWSQDGDTWLKEDFGGGGTWWNDTNCPYVDVLGDFVVIVFERINPISAADTWHILYTKDTTSWMGYYWNMWDDNVSVYHPRVTIMDDNEVLVALDIHDKTDPDSANWWYDTIVFGGELSGVLASDSWSNGIWGSGFENKNYTSPSVEAESFSVLFGGDGFSIIFVQEVYNPSVLSLSTSMIFCAMADIESYDDPPAWYGCYNDVWVFAFDPADIKDQKYPRIFRDGEEVHIAWLNGTDINYRISPDAGVNWIGAPMKVNDGSSSTAIDAYHSPDVIARKGKPCVVWHDSRGSDNIYFQTFGNTRWYKIHTNTGLRDLQVREVGDSWHPSAYYYLWADGSSHDIEAQDSYEISIDTQYMFNQWDDGSVANPTTITVSSTGFNITALYDLAFWLDVQATDGVVTPSSGWQTENSLVTLEAFPPAAPVGGRYAFAGWTGDVTDPRNPCPDCILMDGPKSVMANWWLQWNVTIHTDPTGLTIQVDGIDHIAPYSTWFTDSQAYNINAPSPQFAGPTTRYLWDYWSDAGAQSHDVIVTENWTNFTAIFLTDYLLTIDTNPTGLRVWINAMEGVAPYSYWCLESSSPWIQALSPQYTGVSGERYVWKDWSDGGAQTHQHTCVGAETITANYTFQRSMNITTVPPGLNVIVDGMPQSTPRQFWFDDGSNHTVEAYESIVVGANNRYNFSHWSDFGDRIHDIWANTSDWTLTAYYDYQYKITIQANYPGLSIYFDGSTFVLPYVYWCDEMTTHFVEAPTMQGTGDKRYSFSYWSDGGAQAHMITCDAPMILQVNYELGYKVYVNTTLDGLPASLDVILDGVTYSTPAVIWWPGDTMMPLDTPEFQPDMDPISGTRFRFVDWDDSIIKSRMVSIVTPGQSFVANFVTQHKLTLVNVHGTPVTIPVGNPVVDGIYFDAGTVVEIQVPDTAMDTVDHRWTFVGWSSADPGGYVGPDNPTTVVMDNPITQTASWADQCMLSIVTQYGTPQATGWTEQQSTSEYWYDPGATASFWVEAEVMISPTNDSKAIFNTWIGGTNGTVMVDGMTVTAVWDEYYLVVVGSDYGTVPSPEWVMKGGSYLLDIEEYTLQGSTKQSFDFWATTDTANGGYVGSERQVTLTVVGAITQVAEWKTQHLLTIVTEHGTPSAIGWEDMESPSKYWYVENSNAYFWVAEEIIITPNETKVVFDGWTGESNGTIVDAPFTVTANWHLEYMVTVESEWGIVPEPEWIREGEIYSLAMQGLVEDPENDDIRYLFHSWSTEDAENGGYSGTEREIILTVTGAIKQTANWNTQYRLIINSTYPDEPDNLGSPSGAGWHNDGSYATVEVAGSEKKDGWVYRFERWIGSVHDSLDNKTTVTMDGPMLLEVEWSKSKESEPLANIWWVAIFVAIGAIVAAVVVAFMKSRKPAELVAEETEVEEEPEAAEEGEDEAV